MNAASSLKYFQLTLALSFALLLFRLFYAFVWLDYPVVNAVGKSKVSLLDLQKKQKEDSVGVPPLESYEALWKSALWKPHAEKQASKDFLAQLEKKHSQRPAPFKGLIEGIIMGSSDKGSLIIVKDPDTGTRSYVKMGEAVQGWIVYRIEKSYVMLRSQADDQMLQKVLLK